MGDFSHTLLILLATQKLILVYGMAKAASFAAGLYVLYASFSMISGWLADRWNKGMLLAVTCWPQEWRC